MGVPETTLVAVLAALGVAAGTELQRSAALTAHDRAYWSRPLPATILGRAGAQTSFWVHVTHGQPAEVWLQLEDGTVRTGIRQVDNFAAPFDLDGRPVGEASFVLPDDLPLGYHRVHLRSGDEEASAALIVTPGWLGLPERLGGRRTWGLATQLQACGPGSPGVGDLTDLTDLAVWSAGARRRLCAGQSAACGRTDQADGAVAVPARHRGASSTRFTLRRRGYPGIRLPA